MDILDDMGVSKLSAKVFLKKWTTPLRNKGELHLLRRKNIYLHDYKPWVDPIHFTKKNKIKNKLENRHSFTI